MSGGCYIFNTKNKLIMKNKNLLPVVVMLLVTMVLPFFAMAQDPGGGPDAPIDGGVSLLLAAGVGYGVKKYRDARKATGKN